MQRDTYHWKVSFWDPQVNDWLVKGLMLWSGWRMFSAQSCHDFGNIVMTTTYSTNPRLLNIFQLPFKCWSHWFQHCLSAVSPGRLASCPSLTGAFAVWKLTYIFSLYFLEFWNILTSHQAKSWFELLKDDSDDSSQQAVSVWSVKREERQVRGVRAGI